MTDDKKIKEPIVPPMNIDPGMKEYRCPHCNKFLFKGNVQKLNMVCHHCQEMIDVDSFKSFNPE